MPKNWLHVEEAIELVNWVLSLCMGPKSFNGKTTFQNNSTSWLDFPQVFNLPYQFFYTPIHYFNSFGNFREFSIQIY